MTTVEVAGARLAGADAGRGTPLVWGHGLTASRRVEDELGLFDWTRLSGAARVIRYDARSHGQSTGRPVAEEHRWSHLAGDLLAVADAFGAERFVAGGASMGAATAVYAALAAPHRVDALVLVIPPTAWETRAAQAGQYVHAADVVETQGVDGFVELVAEQPLPELFAGEPHLARFRPDVAASLLPSVLRGAAASDLPPPTELGVITVPTLVLAWETDPGHPVSTAERLRDAMPAARLEVATTLADVRRWPERVRGFVAGLPAT